MACHVQPWGAHLEGAVCGAGNNSACFAEAHPRAGPVAAGAADGDGAQLLDLNPGRHGRLKTAARRRGRSDLAAPPHGAEAEAAAESMSVSAHVSRAPAPALVSAAYVRRRAPCCCATRAEQTAAAVALSAAVWCVAALQHPPVAAAATMAELCKACTLVAT